MAKKQSKSYNRQLTNYLYFVCSLIFYVIFTDYFIRQISIGISVLGIIMLLVFSQIFEPRQMLIKNISEEFVGQEVVIKGIVKNPFFTKNILFFEIFDLDKIKAVKFSPTASELDLIKEQAFLEVHGTIKKYRGELEIIVKEVKEIG